MNNGTSSMKFHTYTHTQKKTLLEFNRINMLVLNEIMITLLIRESVKIVGLARVSVNKAFVIQLQGPVFLWHSNTHIKLDTAIHVCNPRIPCGKIGGENRRIPETHKSDSLSYSLTNTGPCLKQDASQAPLPKALL